MTSHRMNGALKEHVATLGCGNRVVYASRALLPRPGETVPCLLHGYCDVVANAAEDREVVGRRPRRPPRTIDELVTFVRAHHVVTLLALRRERFTLRLVHAAVRSGHLALDWEEQVRIADAAAS